MFIPSDISIHTPFRAFLALWVASIQPARCRPSIPSPRIQPKSKQNVLNVWHLFFSVLCFSALSVFPVVLNDLWGIETCGTPANTKKFPERLAGLPQTPKIFSLDLRDSRKHSLLRQNVSPVAAGIFFDPRGRLVIRKITAQPSDRSFINKK